MKKLKSYKVLLFCLISISCYGRHAYYEKEYQKKFATYIDGQIEYVLQDKSRVDILTGKYAIEVDFCEKWAEGIGQALYYAYMTGLQPGLVIIVENEDNEKRYLDRVMPIVEKYNITLWIIYENFIIRNN